MATSLDDFEHMFNLGPADRDFEKFTDEEKKLFQTYVGEGLFFRKLLHSHLDRLGPKRVLEVGSGMGLLSFFATEKVDQVVSLEPESSGFELMTTFRKLLLSGWGGRTFPDFRTCFLNELSLEETFDFAYCINVLEHVANPEVLMDEIYERLNPGGKAWFVLPNYAFPYEQHFEVPIIINKRVTGAIFRNRIRYEKKFPNPIGLWEELSWPSARELKKHLLSNGWTHEFGKEVIDAYFARLDDSSFLERKGSLYKTLHFFLRKLKPIVIGAPVLIRPVIEITVHKPI